MNIENNTELTHALIVDDEPDIRELLEITLSRMGINCDSAANIKQARKFLANNNYHLCLTDLRLPDGDGIELVSHIQKEYSQTPVAVFTAHGNMDIAISAMKAGAFDFISKPVNLSSLRKLINTALSLQEAKPQQDQSPVMLGEAENIVSLRNTIAKVARSQAPVFINGESGTGKEVAARAIHYQGGRRGGPFIPVNCGAIPRELMESEFFGHKKGSFTGAHADKIGLFQAAEGGTLFLDEVADLPLDMQVKLLRAIQEKAIRPIGSEHEISVDIRILSATHKNLNQEITLEKFRSDLFYRINVIQIDTPPLREHKEDIPLLTQYFINKFSKNIDVKPPNLSGHALSSLMSYSFPGNVRELENILERAFTLCDENIIQLEDLQLPHEVKDLTLRNHNTLEDVESLDDYLEDIERDIIIKTLEKARWNKTAAAKLLGLSFRSFRYRI